MKGSYSSLPRDAYFPLHEIEGAVGEFHWPRVERLQGNEELWSVSDEFKNFTGSLSAIRMDDPFAIVFALRRDVF